MPTYDYICEKCDASFELIQSMKDAALTVCPKDKCGQKRWGKGRVRRAVGTGAGLIFKGTGFYITDYRSEGYKEAAKKDAAPTASTPEAKPAGDTKKPAETKAAAPAKSGSKPAAKKD